MGSQKMGSQKLGTDSRGLLTSRCLKIQKYGRLWPWQIILKKFRSSQSLLLDAPTSAECQGTRSTAVDSLPLLVLRLVSPRSVETSIPRMVRSFGSISVRNQASTSMVSLLVHALQIRLASMPSLEMSPEIS